jgi:hypothetical protein
MEMSVEVDSEEVSYAQDLAGVVFASTVFRLTGTNTDTLDAAVQVLGFHQYSDLTPTGTGVTA